MASATQTSSRRRLRLPGPFTVRARVIAAVLALTALALAIAGLTAYSLERASIEQRVLGYLDRASDEFRVLADQGDPNNGGKEFTNPHDLIWTAMRRQVLAANEGELGVIGDRIAWMAPDGVPFRPELDEAFVNTVLPLCMLDHVTTGRMTTSMADYVYAVTPVYFPNLTPGQAHGALVHVFDLRAEEAVLQGTYTTYTLVALGSLVMVGFLIWLLVGRLLQPIRLLRTTAEDITEHDLTRRIPVYGRDDLSALTRTVNAMLDRLNGALSSQRQLLDDVGHELRTPVTIVRGHLELMDPSDAEDVRATRTLALDELDRMGRLVNDLLTLAKAERTDFIQPEPCDVGRLTDETLEKARGLAPRRWRLDDLADTEAVLDPQRIAQAWLQLASNAVRYSPDDTPIALGSAVRGHQLWLWVRDQGIGIAPDQHERVLRRFGRGPNAGVRTDGTGLGLAIVNTIATGHGGRVDIDSVPGEGSTISLVLPLRPTPTRQESTP